MTIQFETGKTYQGTQKGKETRTYTVTRRTDKTVWFIVDESGKVIKSNVNVYSDAEYITPDEPYWFCEFVKATREVQNEGQEADYEAIEIGFSGEVIEYPA